MKKIICIIAIGITMLTSCESNSVEIPPATQTEILLNKKIETDDEGFSTETTYSYSGNKLIKEEAVYDLGDGIQMDITDYTYIGETLTRIDDSYIDPMGDETNDYVILEYDTTGRLIIETGYYAGNTTVSTYVYNTDGTLTHTRGVGEVYETVHVSTYLNGNLSSISSTTQNATKSYNLVYDDKNSPFKNIHQADVFRTLWYFSIPNNELSSTQTSGSGIGQFDYTTTYTYTSDNYPLTSMYVYAGGQTWESTLNTEYFYQ